MFQYYEVTTGMFIISNIMFIVWNVAVAPPLPQPPSLLS
jgi:hypothetical protein